MHRWQNLKDKRIYNFLSNNFLGGNVLKRVSKVKHLGKVYSFTQFTQLFYNPWALFYKIDSFSITSIMQKNIEQFSF